MAKQSGLGDDLMISGYDLGCDIGSVGNVGGGPTALDMTGICKSAMERIGGVRDGRCQFMAFFNPAEGRVHERLSALPRADVLVTYHRSTVLGKPAACMVGKQVNYDGTRGDDGSFTFAVDAQSNGFALEWGNQLTAGVRTDDAATEGDGIDLGTGPTEFGLQAYLHVTAFDGTDATVTIQDSPDNSTWTDLADGAFAEITSATPGWQRIETARDATVNRYLRAVSTTTGGFTALSIAVIAVRNDVEVVF